MINIIIHLIAEINRALINQDDLIIKRNIDFHINLNYSLVILFIKTRKFINYHSLDRIIRIILTSFHRS